MSEFVNGPANRPRRSRTNVWLGLACALLFLVLTVARGVLVYALATNDPAATTSGHASPGSQSPAKGAPAKLIGGTVNPQVEPAAGEPVAVWTTTLVESLPPEVNSTERVIDAVYEHPNGSRFSVHVMPEDDGTGQEFLDSLEERSASGRLECGLIKDSKQAACVGTVEGIGLITVQSTVVIPEEASKWADAFVAEMLKTR